MGEPVRVELATGGVVYFGPDGLPLDTFEVPAEDLPRLLVEMRVDELLMDTEQMRRELVHALFEGGPGYVDYDEECLEEEVRYMLGDPDDLGPCDCVAPEFVDGDWPDPHGESDSAVRAVRLFRVHGAVAGYLSGRGYGVLTTHDELEVAGV